MEKATIEGSTWASVDSGFHRAHYALSQPGTVSSYKMISFNLLSVNLKSYCKAEHSHEITSINLVN